MSELNREQIIKALECCYTNELSCLDCPFQASDKYMECAGLALSALSLIKELNKANIFLNETIGKNAQKALEVTLEEIENTKADTLSKVELYFSMRFGTYTKDDTVKVTEVFDILKEITEKLTEDTNDKIRIKSNSLR